MRILHINISRGGISHYGVLYAEALNKVKGDDALSILDESVLHSPMLEPILKNTNHIILKRGSPLEKISSIFSILKIISKFKPDIIHDSCGSSSPSNLLYFPFAARRAPLLITEHDPSPHSQLGHNIRSKLARYIVHKYSRIIMVHGKASRAMLLAQGVDETEIAIVRHGNYSFFDQGNFSDVKREPRTILFFGELRPNKGVELLIPIAEKLHLKYKDVKFIVAGSKKFPSELKKSEWPGKLDNILEKMRKRPYFELHEGYIPDEDVELLFKKAGITLLPYLDATASGVANIAMPLRSTVVATNVGDMPEMVIDQKTGLICDVDIDDIVKVISSVFADPEKSRQIAANAFKLSMIDYSWENIAQHNARIYEKALGK